MFEEAEREGSGASLFDPEIYRIVGKCLKEGRLRVIPLLQAVPGQAK
jgi:hypothetical protein